MNAGGPAGQLIDGRFELLQRLGGGGMGLVWRARDTMLQREVALKEVRSAEQPFQPEDPVAAHVQRERVLREARALARLHHPNVVTIYHIVDTVELRHPWLVMELVAGGSLDGRLERGPLTPQEAARVGRGVLAALRAAHEAGIQHRDVKPANVLLRADGTPVLTDFGIAALNEATNLTNLTATGSLIGSPEFIAPERIRGQEGDPASDLWSLGMLLYVAVEGHNPLRRDTNLATLAAVLDAPIPEPVRSGPLTPALAALLVRDPAARPDAARLDQLLAAAEQGPYGSSWSGSGSSAVFAASPGGSSGSGTGGTPHSPSGGSSLGQSPYGGAYNSTGAMYGQPGAGPNAPGTTGSGTGSGGYAPFGVPYGPADALPAGAVVQRQPRSRRKATFFGAVASTAVLGVAAALLVTLHSGTSSALTTGGSTPSTGITTSSSAVTGTGAGSVTRGPSASAASGAGLLTPAGINEVLTAARSKLKASKLKINELDIFSDHAYMEVPLASDATEYDGYQYDAGGQFEKWDQGSVMTPGNFDPGMYDWSKLPGLIAYARANLKVTDITEVFVSLSTDWEDDAGDPTLRVYVSDAHNGSGYLSADPSGKIIATYPKDS
jgi:serine/threonine protein kinase